MRTRTALTSTAIAAALLTACTTTSTPAAKPTRTKTATSSTAAISKKCSDAVFDMLLDEINGKKTPDYRPDACANLTDKQWNDVVDEQGDKAIEVGKSLEDSLNEDTDTSADEPAPAKVVFKVWGSAPAGVDITYGSDSENLDGSGLPMTKTLKVKDDALYYSINAQLSGGGDVRCSVTIGSETKEGHAKGGYNICSAQINNLDGWQ